MSRWNAFAELVRVSVEVGPDGSASETRSSRRVPANRRTVGATSWAAALSAGLHADAEVELRSRDYLGEQELSMDGTEYEVERVQDSGEFCRLTLKRRLRSG